MGRSPCFDGSSELKKGPWTPEEDELLVSHIQKHGVGSWRTLPKATGLKRCGKSCRLRWSNYLKPDIKRGRFTEEEEDVIIKLHSVLGNKWSRIAAHLPGRTDNEIKNHWNTHLRKKLLLMGIDPVTHKSRADLNLLANLSQLLSTPPNLGALMNPWDINNALNLQPNVMAEVAKLQVLQNIFQILNTSSSSSLPDINQTMTLNKGLIPNVNGIGNIHTTTPMCSGSHHAFCQVPSYAAVPSQAIADKYDNNTPELYNTSLDTYCNKSLSNTSYDDTLDGNTLPSLVNFSPEVSTVNQIESNTNSINKSSDLTPTTTSDFFEGWEKLLDDGDSDFWKELIN